MYNLFVTAEDGAWDKPFYELDRSRFLEYTNDNIAAVFKNLTRIRTSALKSYPCIFAYEGSTGNIRIGYLKSIKERGRSILIEYDFYPDIPEIAFSEISDIAPLLDIRKWEMSRTHWAIKDENLFERLKNASLINADIANKLDKTIKVKKQSKPHDGSSKISTVQEFIDRVIIEKGAGEDEVFYRGHSDKFNYKLEPSLFRKDKEGNYLYLDSEDVLYRELLVSNPSDFQSDENTLDRLVRMQHYSLPTRLLDITSNPLIALYFSCRSKNKSEVSGGAATECDGEVVIFKLKKEQVKYFDSDTASCIANLVQLPKSEKNSILFGISKDDFNEQLPIKRLVHFIRQEKPFFEKKVNPEDLRKTICVKGKKNNSRISSQSGAFLLFGHDAVLDEKGTPEIRVTRITVANKSSILKELDLLNINDSTVFPYIENSARYIAQKYAFKKN